MGFIHGNTNSLEAFLTDYGLQTFYRNGLKTDTLLFSACDDDANYDQFKDPLFYNPVDIFNQPHNQIVTIKLGPGLKYGGEATGGTQTIWVTDTIVTGATRPVYVTGTTVTGHTQVVFVIGNTTQTMPATPPNNQGGTPGTAGVANSEQWNNGGARIYLPGYPIDGDGVLDVALTLPHLWVNGSDLWNGNSDRNTVDSRMNATGIWRAPGNTAPLNEWIGFSRKVTVVGTAKTVYIGMAADNKFNFRLNGTDLVIAENISGGPNFAFWHIYPVVLRPGDNFIEMSALNTGSVGGFGAEIYDMTKAQLMAATNGNDYNASTNPGGLKCIFSTKNMIGQAFDLGDTTGFNCPATGGWFLDTSNPNADPFCSRIVTTGGTQTVYVTGTTVTGHTEMLYVTGTTVTGHTEVINVSGYTQNTYVGRTINSQHHVYTQTNKRGAILDGVTYRRPVLKTNEDTLKNYLTYEGDLTTEQDYSLLTYRKINDIKQFNIKGVNGLYLTYPKTVSGATNIYDVDNYPQDVTDPEFYFVNSRYAADQKSFVGSNDTRRLNQTSPISQINRISYLVVNEKYDLDFDLHFKFDTSLQNLTVDQKKIDVSVYVLLGKNKIPLEIYTQNSDPNTVLSSDTNTALSKSLVEISADHHKIVIKDILTTTAYVKCRLRDGICKKNKDLAIVIDYNGQYGGDNTITSIQANGQPQLVSVHNPVFDFEIKNLNTSFVGVSVSNPNINFKSAKDVVYVLNKNTKSVIFSALTYETSILRNSQLAANDRNLVLTNTNVNKIGDFISCKYTLAFKGQEIGELDIKYPYSYYIKENTLILPFQSFPITATYRVIDPGVLPKQYYGQSLTQPQKHTGVLDVNFLVSCYTKDGTPINEEITISVNLINGGFERSVGNPVLPSDDCPPAGELLGYICVGCYKRAKYADGDCGYTYGPKIKDEDFCGICGDIDPGDSTGGSGNYIVENNMSSFGDVSDVIINGESAGGSSSSPVGFVVSAGSWPVQVGSSLEFGPPYQSGTYTVIVIMENTFNGGFITVTADPSYSSTTQISGDGNYTFINVPYKNIKISVS